MVWVALGIGVPIALGLVMLVIVMRSGLQMRRLVDDGIEAQGRVIDRIRHTGSTYQSQKRLKYAYWDLDRVRYERVSLVSDHFWNTHPRGTPIAIVYLRGHPQVSAPLELVKQARQAMGST